MAIYTLTPSQLKGAGIYNSFEIPAGGGGSFASINSFLFDGVDDMISMGDVLDMQMMVRMLIVFPFGLKQQVQQAINS